MTSADTIDSSQHKLDEMSTPATACVGLAGILVPIVSDEQNDELTIRRAKRITSQISSS